MADTLYTRALVRAAEIQGSTQALASLLRVPENTLLRWMAGRAQMPLQAFLKVIETISEDERQHAPSPSSSGAGSEKFRFRAGSLEARCSRCDGADFVTANPGEPLRYINELVCCACGERVVHGNLIAQLAKDSVHHSRAMTAARQKRLAKTVNKPAQLQENDKSAG